MASIHSLPTEILAEIGALVGHEQYSPPIQLLTVSKLWYTIVMNTPQAWSALKVHCIPDEMDPGIPILERWINRSAACPLYLQLDLEDADANPLPILHRSSTLVQQKDRIRELYIHHASVWSVWSLEPLLPASNLHKCWIAGDDLGGLMSPLELLEFPLFLRHTPQAPAIRTLSLEHCKFDEPACPLNTIQDLNISQCTASMSGMKSLLQAPNLRRLSIRNWVLESDVPNKIDQLGPLNLGKLETLELHQFPSKAFRDIVVPSLTQASISDMFISGPQLDVITTLLSKEQPPIRQLKLDLIAPLGNLVLLLPNLPSLQYLDLSLNGIHYHPYELTRHPGIVDYNLRITPVPNAAAAWKGLLDAENTHDVVLWSSADKIMIEGKKKQTA